MLHSSVQRRILLLHSHPVPVNSFSAAIADTFEQSAIEQGHDVNRVNLSGHDDPAQCYRPYLSRKEREGYFAFIGNGEKNENTVISPEVKNHLDLLRWCDTLVLVVYPTWWMNTPASLKEFFGSHSSSRPHMGISIIDYWRLTAWPCAQTDKH
jgi:putative NADPH-quinone reductase